VKTFYLVDGHAQIFRAYYAPFSAVLTSPDGEPTKATYVFTQTMLNILRDKEPDYFAVALDHGDATTERRKLYPEYKANRDAAPEDLVPQFGRIEEMLRAMDIPTFKVEGQEADDIIATIARIVANEEIDLHIVSKDKDLHQLLTDNVKLWDPGKDEIIDPATLEEKMGFTPDQAVEIQTLTGDSTDNVPGVPGIGPKKAAALIRKYGSVEEIRKHSSELTPKMRENVEKHGTMFDLTRRLVTLEREVDLDFTLADCEVSKLDISGARPLFEELGFRRLLDQLDASETDGDADGLSTPAAVRERPKADYHLVNDADSFAAFLEALKRQTRFAVDTETTSLRAADCDIVGLSFSWKAAEGWYVPIRSSTSQTLDAAQTLGALRPILEDPRVEKIGQNIKYDRVALLAAGVDLRGVTFDTMVASYLLDPDRRSHGMDALARDILGHETISITELIGKGKNQKSMLDVELTSLADYAAEDADITWRLYESLEPRMAGDEIRRLFYDVEMPLVLVLSDMEFAGVTLDRNVLDATKEKLGARVEELTHEIHGVAGREFTIDSPKQLAGVLFDEQGLRVVKKTKTGRSTDASVLQTLAVETAHPLPALVLEYRELTKLLGTYVGPLPELISPRSQRVHASFHQTVAATGRLSSSDPNLQNIPVRTEQGREIRKAFVASATDRVLITADYSQIELRILAHLSKDDALITAFESDQDIHSFVAAQLAGVPIEEVSKDDRNRAKAVNFGIIYGQGAFGLARNLGISRAHASDFIDDYKRRYPGIPRFMDECIAEADRKGHVTTMLGRRRPIPEIRSKNRNLRAQGERLAINTVVQGSAADMIKVAMVRIRDRITRESLDLELLIQVHDELVLDGPRDDVESLADIVRDEMIAALPLDVPMKVDTAWGENWLEGKA